MGVVTIKKKTSPSQRRAADKWDSKNKEKVAYIKKRSAAKKFAEIAELEDIEILIQILQKRKEKLNTKL